MTDEERAVIEAAINLERVLWPRQGDAQMVTSQLDQAMLALHVAVQRWEHTTKTAGVAAGE